MQFVSDTMSYILLRGRWCFVIALYVHAPFDDKNDDVKDSFCDEGGRVFNQFPRYAWKFCWTIQCESRLEIHFQTYNRERESTRN
jgi:hypothetical protein